MGDSLHFLQADNNKKKDVCGFRFLDILKGFSTDFSKHSYIYNA